MCDLPENLRGLIVAGVPYERILRRLVELGHWPTLQRIRQYFGLGSPQEGELVRQALQATCERCGRPFIRAHHARRFCGDCKPGPLLERPRLCKRCGMSFLPHAPRDAYCSPDCREAAQRERRRPVT